MKIALVKQDVYQDLYVCEKNASATDLLFSSIMRVGPIGLFTKLHADFLIVKEATEFSECTIWETVIQNSSYFKLLKDKHFSELPSPKNAFFKPGSPFKHSDFSISVNQVNWKEYDVVISINCSVPEKIVKANPNTLWCYMIGEANKYTDKVHFGYDVCLNQETRGILLEELGVLDFPYSFTSSTCIESLMQNHLKRNSLRNGIYIEINSIKERPVTKIPENFTILKSLGFDIYLHHQLISQNLKNVFDAKYFVKVGGRRIRGNSAIEAISCGTLVLMAPEDIIHTQILPKETWVYSIEDVMALINKLEASPDEYKRLQDQQRLLLDHFVYEMPLKNIENCLKYKRTKNTLDIDVLQTANKKSNKISTVFVVFINKAIKILISIRRRIN